MKIRNRYMPSYTFVFNSKANDFGIYFLHHRLIHKKKKKKKNNLRGFKYKQDFFLVLIS